MVPAFDIASLRAAQMEKGWADERLADEAGVSKATVWRTMNSKNRPNASTVRKLAFALGLRMRDLVIRTVRRPAFRDSGEAEVVGAVADGEVGGGA